MQKARQFASRCFIWTLDQLARLIIMRYRPGIVGVTGSVGKTSTKRAIASVLCSERSVRVSAGNLNNELGLALTVIGDWNEKELYLVSRECPAGERRPEKIIFLSKVFIRGLSSVLFARQKEYPEILILEYGVDRPDDMKRLLRVARPNISVITAIGDTPVHVEFFEGPEEIVREKARLVEVLPTHGFAVLNCDDPAVYGLRTRTRAHCMTFGFGNNAEVRVMNFEHRMRDGMPEGIGFKVGYVGSIVPVQLHGIFGKVHAVASAAACAVGLIFGMNLVSISEALKNYHAARGRGELIAGIKHTYIIDDTYNASPLSMHAALDTLESLPGKRKVAVLGDMLELGAHSMDAHGAVGEHAAKAAQLLLAVGPRAKFIAERAKARRMPPRNIKVFDTAEDAAKHVASLLKDGDLVLVKGSHAMELQKVVEEIRAA